MPAFLGVSHLIHAVCGNAALTCNVMRHSCCQQQVCPAHRAVLNDSYRTDVSLVHAPYVVAIGCMVVAAALTDRDLQPWLEGLACDMDQVGHPQGLR